MSLLIGGLIAGSIGLVVGCISALIVVVRYSGQGGAYDSRTAGIAMNKDDGASTNDTVSYDETAALMNGRQETPLKDAGPAQGLTLGFRLPDGSERTISFGSRRPPLGLGFAGDGTTMPYPSSHASSLGIASGWAIVSVNGHQVKSSNTEQVKMMIKQALATQDKPGTLAIGFALPDGTSTIVDFSDRSLPIGVQFSLGRPCLVTNVLAGGHGDQLGVKENWCVHYVNGQHVSSATDRNTGFEVIKTKLEEKEAADHANLEARLRQNKGGTPGKE